MTDGQFPGRIGIGDGPGVPCRVASMDFTRDPAAPIASGARRPVGAPARRYAPSPRLSEWTAQMPDLDGAVRAMLDGWLDDICGAWHDGCAIEDHANAIRMRAAIEAVLDRHKPVPAGVPNKPHLADCAACMDVGPEVCSPVGYPCETVEDIAKALGVTDGRP